MATINKQAMRPYKVNPKRLMRWKEKASQTFKYGDVIQIDTSGGKNRCAIADTDETTVLGVAAQDASGTTDADVLIYCPDEDETWIGNVTGDTLDRADVGTKVGIVKDSAGIWLLDLADTTNTRVKITRMVDEHADTNGRVEFSWLAANLHYGSA